jgi:hypothetical protein
MNTFNLGTSLELQWAAESILANIVDFRKVNGPWLSYGQKAMARDVIFRAKALCHQAGVASSRIDYYDGLMF